MVVPIGVPSKKTSTVLLFSAVPVIINSSSLVIPSLGLSPVSLVIPVITGAGGGVTSSPRIRMLSITTSSPSPEVITSTRIFSKVPVFGTLNGKSVKVFVMISPRLLSPVSFASLSIDIVPLPLPANWIKSINPPPSYSYCISMISVVPVLPS